MGINSLSKCKTASEFCSFAEKLTPKRHLSSRRFVYKQHSYSMNDLVLQLYKSAKGADPAQLRKGVIALKKLEKEGNAQMAKLSPFQKLLYRISKAVGNHFFRLKHGRSREEFLREIQNKIPKPVIPKINLRSVAKEPQQDEPMAPRSTVSSPAPLRGKNQDQQPDNPQQHKGSDDPKETQSKAPDEAVAKGSAVPVIVFPPAPLRGKINPDQQPDNPQQHKGSDDPKETQSKAPDEAVAKGHAVPVIVFPPAPLRGKINPGQPDNPQPKGAAKEPTESKWKASDAPSASAKQVLEQKEIFDQLQATVGGIREEQRYFEDALQEEAISLDQKKELSASAIEKKGEREALGLDPKHCDMVAYIYHYLNELAEEKENETKQIQDLDNIVFEKGRIIKASSQESAKASHKLFYHILKETFGTVLAKRVFGRYGLSKRETITLGDLKKAMVGVAMNVLEKDLKTLFKHIQRDPPGDLTSYLAGNSLFREDKPVEKELYLGIKRKKDFNELSAIEINFLHSAFRTVAFDQYRYKVSDVLKYLKQGDDGKDFLYRHDLEALALMESWSQLDLNHPDLALGEYAGKSLAYLELKPGLILPMPSIDDGVPHLYQVAHSLPSKNDAVVAHILAPLNDQQALFPKKPDAKNEEAFLVFRGTLPNPGAMAGGMSLYRDFHYDGIGRVTYDAREKEIQQMTEEYLKSKDRDVTLRIAGHSLGACDTQRALVSLLEMVADSEDGSPWRKLKNIAVTTFNAPKVNQSVNRRFKEAIKKINQRGIDVTIDLKHVRFSDKTYEDTIQKFGDILLGADLHGGTGEEVFKHAPNLKRTIFKMHMDDDQGLAQGFLVRHGYRPFNKALCTTPYKMVTLSAEKEEERKEMEKEMAGTYYWDPSEMNALSTIVGNLVWYTSWFGLRQPKKVVQAVLVNGPHSAGLALNRLFNRVTYGELDERRDAS